MRAGQSAFAAANDDAPHCHATHRAALPAGGPDASAVLAAAIGCAPEGPGDTQVATGTQSVGAAPDAGGTTSGREEMPGIIGPIQMW